MATVLRRKHMGHALGQLLGSMGGRYVGDKREEEKQQKQKLQAEQDLQSKLQKYKQLQEDPEFQNMPLEGKATLTSLMFGEDYGKNLLKAEELRIKEAKNKEQKAEKPALTLNEELNQRDKRAKERIKNMSLPFEKRDAFGNIFLDFQENEKQKAKTLGKISKELKAQAKDMERLYRSYGQPVPEDIEQSMKEEILVDMNGIKVPLEIVENLEVFDKKFPPQKHKGKRAKDENGYVLESDGNHWKIVGYEGE